MIRKARCFSAHRGCRRLYEGRNRREKSSRAVLLSFFLFLCRCASGQAENRLHESFFCPQVATSGVSVGSSVLGEGLLAVYEDHVLQHYELDLPEPLRQKKNIGRSREKPLSASRRRAGYKFLASAENDDTGEKRQRSSINDSNRLSSPEKASVGQACTPRFQAAVCDLSAQVQQQKRLWREFQEGESYHRARKGEKGAP